MDMTMIMTVMTEPDFALPLPSCNIYIPKVPGR